MSSRSRSRSRSRSVGTGAAVATGGGCSFVLVFWVILLCFSGLAVQYDLATVLGAHPPFWACFIGGIFTGGVAVPVAVIVWIITLCGVHVPFWQIAMMGHTAMVQISF